MELLCSEPEDVAPRAVTDLRELDEGRHPQRREAPPPPRQTGGGQAKATVAARRFSRQSPVEFEPADGANSSRCDGATKPSRCWPCRRFAGGTTSRVSSSPESAQLHEERCDQSGGVSATESTSKPEKKPRSKSLAADLMKIEADQRLLVAGQKRLLAELSDELCAGGLGGGRLDEQAAANSARDLDGRRAAVECRNLSYHAGLGSFQRRPILNGISLTVPEGAIYGLLGPSGCGKTTLLRCVAGRLSPEAGRIRVFGFEPNEPGSRIPGPAIGYMPQELSIYEEFTMYETLAYFGRINRVRASLLRARIDFLLSFLNLPKDKRRLVKHLSGGQKRRVSLAVALVHSPPLLILDEPTVGVDPLLRQVIWKYLVTLATSERITIIITTHYIEEARQANIVGLMRQGQMLAEDSPAELLRRHNQTTLENVFLKLCLTSDESACLDEENERGHKLALVITDLELGKKHADLGEPTSGLADAEPADTNKWRPMERGEKYAPKTVGWGCWLSVLWALVWKNHLRLKRNPPVIAFEFILPAFQVLLFCWCIGGDPHDIPLAVVNEESVPQASRLFLNAISRSVFTQTPYDNLSAAIESVEHGRSLAVVHIPEGYTRHLQERLLHPADATNETISNATVKLYPDLTNLHLALALESTFREAFVKFARDTLHLLGYESQLAELPIKIERTVFGSTARTTGGYLEFMAPGVIISITYVMATGLTALAFILEKRDGLLERSQVSGVTTSQTLLAHALLQVAVMSVQIVLVLVVSFLVFRVPSRGPLGWVLLLVLLQGCAGMSYGLLISAVCSEENTAVMMLVGTFYINLILAGIIWPVEAMPDWLRLFSYLQPQTLPTESLRHILSRGWSVGAASVQLGFAVTVAWLAVFLVGAGLCMRYIK